MDVIDSVREIRMSGGISVGGGDRIEGRGGQEKGTIAKTFRGPQKHLTVQKGTSKVLLL